MAAAPGSPTPPPRVCVLGPTPLLMIELEAADDDAATRADVHLHPGGQGLWVSRMAQSLGADVTICGPFGGEIGGILLPMLASEQFTVRSVPYNNGNGAYIHDQRSGNRETLAHMVPQPMSRHELDDLYGTALVEALESDVVVVTGAEPAGVMPAGFYSRIVRDVRSAGKPVIADLSGEAARAAAAEGPAVLKMSHEEIRATGLAQDDTLAALESAGKALVAGGVGAAIISRAGAPTLVVTEDAARLLHGPVVTPLDHRGAGDSLTAGVAVAMGRGGDIGDAARLGAAAGALNVTRRGLGTGRREQIERFAEQIAITELTAEDRAGPGGPTEDDEPSTPGHDPAEEE